MKNISSFRKDFPIFKKKIHGIPLVYLDSAATAQKPEIVIDAMSNFAKNQYGTVHRAIYNLAHSATALHQKTREEVRQFIHAKKTEEIIFTRGTTESINLVAYSFGKAFIKPHDEILISEMEHHANIVPWQILCEDREAILKVIPVDNKGEIVFEQYQRLLNNKTKLVSIAHIANSIGTINPIKEMIDLAHQKGAKVLIDGAQAAPHMPINVQDLDADFYVFSGHKLYGPTGIGVLYGKEELLNQMPPYQGGGDMIESVTFAKTTYNSLPLKFEAGTPMIIETIGLGAALNYLQTIGLNAIQEWEKILKEYAIQKLFAVPGVKIIGNPLASSPIISFVVEGVHALDIGTLLDLRGIAIRTGHHCAQPIMNRFGITGTNRISFGLYNSKEDIDYFVVSLSEVIKELK